MEFWHEDEKKKKKSKFEYLNKLFMVTNKSETSALKEKIDEEKGWRKTSQTYVS